LRAHLRRERDPKLRASKLKDTKERGLPIACEVCTFDFGYTYGSHGLDYIECHHRTPLYVTGKTQTRLADLALLCSNCHRMIHRTKQWLTVEELKEVVDAQQQLAIAPDGCALILDPNTTPAASPHVPTQVLVPIDYTATYALTNSGLGYIYER